MAVAAKKIPSISWPKDAPTKGKFLTIKKVMAMASHIANPPQRAVGVV